MITTDAYSLYATVEESMCDATTAALRQGPYRTTLLYANELKRTESNQGTNRLPLYQTQEEGRRRASAIAYILQYGIGLYDIDYYLLPKTPDVNHSKG